jgi:hypothetical protein
MGLRAKTIARRRKDASKAKETQIQQALQAFYATAPTPSNEPKVLGQLADTFAERRKKLRDENKER